MIKPVLARSLKTASASAASRGVGDDGDDGDDDEVLDDHSDEDGDSTGVYLGLDDSDYDEEPSRTK